MIKSHFSWNKSCFQENKKHEKPLSPDKKMPFITLSGFGQISMKPTSQKALHEDVKINQWKLHNALAFFRLITVYSSTTHTKNK